MPVRPPDAEMLARMPMDRDEYEKLRPRGRLTLLKQKLLNLIARFTIHRGLRIWLYRQMGVNIGKDCVVEMYGNLDDQFPELIFFEDHSGPSRHVIIMCHDDVTAKSEDTDAVGFTERHGYVAPVRLKRYSGIGTASILLPGVTVHEGAVVGAGAVVTKDVPPYTVAVGVPARVIKHLKPQPAPAEADAAAARTVAAAAQTAAPTAQTVAVAPQTAAAAPQTATSVETEEPRLAPTH